MLRNVDISSATPRPQTSGRIQQVDPPKASITYTIGALKSRIGVTDIVLFYAILYYAVQNSGLYFLDPAGGLDWQSGARPEGEVAEPRLSGTRRRQGGFGGRARAILIPNLGAQKAT